MITSRKRRKKLKKRKRRTMTSPGDSDIWEFKIYKFKIQKVGEFASRFLNGKQ
jgi:hypothetical protein